MESSIWWNPVFTSFLLFISFSSSTSLHLCPHGQSSALLQLKATFSINCSAYSCGSNIYPKIISWKKGTDCCLWDGVNCDTQTGNVVGLDLSCNCLNGTIHSNSSLFLLHHLYKLNLAYNHFSLSQISSDFGQFTSLTHLNISFSGFSGLVSSAVPQLSRLVFLDLSHNQLRFDRNTFEKLLGSLVSLRDLFLDGIDLYSIAPSSFLNLSSSITYLSLVGCGLKGKFPDGVLHFPHLQTLRLTANDLLVNFPKTNWSSSLRSLEISSTTISGEIPDSIGNLRSLEVLDLSKSHVKGSIPTSLGNLTKLTHLILSSNSITGLLPSSISNLKQLLFLDLSFNNLIGQIPDVFGNFTRLFSLHLNGNNFSGHLPFSAFNLTQLVFLDISENKLVGSLPFQVTGLSLLRELTLSDNFINGIIPSWLFNLTRLVSLEISENKLVGSLPYQVTGLSQLQWLRLGNNFINGRIPSWLFSLPSLVYLELPNNEFTGPIDQFEKPSPLMAVYLGNNEIHGSIPSSFFELMNLETLDLSSNKLSGIVESDNLSKLGKLEILDLSSNTQLSFSSFSSANYSLPNLWSLNLSSCNISGFPDFIRNLEGLVMLDLSHNQIPVIDQGMFLRLENLSILELSSCGISEFPNFLRILKKLNRLTLSNSSIQGRASKCESEGWPSLTYLDLSHNLLTDLDQYLWKNLLFLNLRSNLLEGPVLVPPPSMSIFLVSKNKLTGQIPSLICNLSSLQILDLSDNNLSGTIPQCFGNLSSLEVLDLAANDLIGTIPNCLGFFSNNLYVLDLQKNSLHGSIPDSFAKENMLESLNLNGNDFYGPFPQSLLNCSKLAVLNLGNNGLNDTFPHWLGTLRELQVLVLRSNNFHGSIGKAKTESPFPKLRILDLSHNEFSGVLPTTYFKSFKSMMNLDNVKVGYMRGGRYYQDSVVVSMKGSEFEFQRILTIFTAIDLSSNQFKGKIPERVGELTSLKVLNFSHNSLSGSIPSSMGKLAAIESLDLSSNNLVGEIPEQLTNLKFLAVLNLSQNQLSGPIPQGNQFNTFPHDSYSDNLGLCGVPLSKRCSKNEAPVFQEEGDGSASRFEWKGVMMGYGCGLVFGLSAGYIIFTIGKPEWLMKIVERAGNKLKRYL